VKKKLIFLFLIIISSAILFYLRSEKVARLNVQLAGDSFFEGLKIINKKDGITEWVLTAKRADLSKDGREALLSGIEMKLEKQGMMVQADKGLYNMETKNVSIDGVIQHVTRITSSQRVRPSLTAEEEYLKPRVK